MSAKELIDQAFKKWVERLGLMWWDVDVHFYDDPGEIVRLFRQADNEDVVAAFVDSNWMYAHAKISINLPAFDEMEPREIEKIILHELIHILLNEMRQGELHHEERVVTGLTKAFFWVVAAVEEELKSGAAPHHGARQEETL